MEMVSASTTDDVKAVVQGSPGQVLMPGAAAAVKHLKYVNVAAKVLGPIPFVGWALGKAADSAMERLQRGAQSGNLDEVYDNGKARTPAPAVRPPAHFGGDGPAPLGTDQTAERSSREVPAPLIASAKKEPGRWGRAAAGGGHALGSALWWLGRAVHWAGYGLEIVSYIGNEVSFGLIQPVVYACAGVAGAGKYMAAAGARMSAPDCREDRVALAGRFTATVGPDSATEEF